MKTVKCKVFTDATNDICYCSWGRLLESALKRVNEFIHDPDCIISIQEERRTKEDGEYAEYELSLKVFYKEETTT